jgi:hypothetical protein
MPAPLIAKRQPVVSLPVPLALILVMGGPFLALIYCWQHHLAIHLRNPALNLTAHAALFIIPLFTLGIIHNHLPSN